MQLEIMNTFKKIDFIAEVRSFVSLLSSIYRTRSGKLTAMFTLSVVHYFG